MKKKIAIIGYGGQGAWHARQLLKTLDGREELFISLEEVRRVLQTMELPLNLREPAR